jgi:hypothetical protein
VEAVVPQARRGPLRIESATGDVTRGGHRHASCAIRHYYPATYEQIQGQYKFLMDDKNMFAAEPMSTGNLFNESALLGAPFYPVSGGGRLRATAVELEPWSYFMSAIYFEHPDPGLVGIMTLTLKGDTIDPPINVRFELPQPHAKKEKAKKSGD